LLVCLQRLRGRLGEACAACGQQDDENDSSGMKILNCEDPSMAALFRGSVGGSQGSYS
jgi:hypothetical protein